MSPTDFGADLYNYFASTLSTNETASQNPGELEVKSVDIDMCALALVNGIYTNEDIILASALELEKTNSQQLDTPVSNQLKLQLQFRVLATVVAVANGPDGTGLALSANAIALTPSASEPVRTLALRTRLALDVPVLLRDVLKDKDAIAADDDADIDLYGATKPAPASAFAPDPGERFERNRAVLLGM
jgi:hypothetical protein